MTLEQALDLQLATLLDERSEAVPPSDLLARSLARVAVTRQRSRWRFPAVVLRGSATFGRRTVPAWGLLVLVALVLAALIVVGDQIVQRYLAVVPVQTTLPSIDSTRGPESSVPADTSPPALPIQAGALATTQQIAAFGDRVAWVGTETAMYRTEDGGATWRSVQPEGWSQPYAESFVDAATAYVSIDGGPEIAATHDGGSTWTTTVLDAAGEGSPTFAFSSASTGFVTFVDQSHYDKKDGTGLLIFRTADGGATWSGPTHGLQPHLVASSNKLYAPLGQFYVSSAGISDQYAYENYFDLSEDGGATYTRYDFPTGPLAPKRFMKTVEAIVRGDDGHLLIAIRIDAVQKEFPVVVYRNGDDPSSWTQVAEIPAVAGPLQFLSGSTWVLTGGAPSKILSTTDSGATWRTVIPPMSLYHLQAGFGTPRWTGVETGWIVDQCLDLTFHDDGSPTGYDCGDRSRDLVLLVTTDGGATWTEIGT
jgi:photosystem II stability/assembly factor-like uncharacterized protein